MKHNPDEQPEQPEGINVEPPVETIPEGMPSYVSDAQFTDTMEVNAGYWCKQWRWNAMVYEDQRRLRLAVLLLALAMLFLTAITLGGKRAYLFIEQ